MHRGRAFGFALAMLFGATTALYAATPAPTYKPSQYATYMIALSAAPLVEHAGAVRTKSASPAKSLSSKSAIRAAMTSADGVAYLKSLDKARSDILSSAAQRLGRVLQPRQVFRHVANGMAVELTPAEAMLIAALPGVAAVRRERIEHLHTDAGPQWIGANELWTGQVDGVASTKGEGAVIGVIDTGIDPTHIAFAATGGDGYVHTNPRGKFYGLCAVGKASCNNKLIGIYDFSNEGTNGVDVDGHGSHVSGIAAGNAISASLHGMTTDVTRNVSGVAPHANLIMYKACNATPIDSSGDGTCAESWLVAAIDQAVADNVDVINYSIGGGTADPYALLADSSSDVYAFFQARAAGVVIAVSAGNDGPDPNTLDEPGNAPWVIGVANASHNRRFVNSLTNLTGVANAPGDLRGQALTAGYGPATIVYAANYNFPLCGTGATQSVPTGASNPWPAGTFHGEIVVCDRGIYGRVEKGYNVKAAGGGGMILANAASNGESVEADDHYLPAVHLGYQEGQALEAWLAISGTHTGTISGVTAQLDNGYGDILEGSSSRGPYGFTGGVLKPDVTAPGTNILSAAPSGNQLAILTGTSMASPHVAGSAALVLAAHPDWNPAQVESALLGTALAGSVRKEDGITTAAPTDAGSGRVQPSTAANAGLYLPLVAVDYTAQNPNRGGDLRKLNRSGIEDEHCFQQCTFTRTVTDMSGGGTWQVSTAGTTGVKITVLPNQFSLVAGASQVLQITLDVSDPRLPNTWVGGRIVLHKSTGGKSASDLALTAAVHADGGTTQAFQEITAKAPSGLVMLSASGLPGLASATYTSTSLDTASTTVLFLPADPAPGDPFNLPGSGKQVTFFPHLSSTYSTAPDGTSGTTGRLQIIDVSTQDAILVNLYAGIDSNGDGQAQASEMLCKSSASNTSANVARCVIDLSGTSAPVWALVQVVQGGGGTTYSISLTSAQPAVTTPMNISQSVVVTGPGHVPASTAFPMRLSWNLPEPAHYYGAVLIDGAAGLAGQSAMIPFLINRNPGGNDVINPGLGSGALEPGETLNHSFFDVPPGVSSLQLLGATQVIYPGYISGYLMRANFPLSSSSAQVATAPLKDATAVPFAFQGSAAAQNALTVRVSPGRWYVVATNANAGRLLYSFDALFLADSSGGVPIAPGAYFNPERSGHGVFISQAGGQQALDWYTYLEDGTPTWYQAQATAPSPAGQVWTAQLYRVNWNGISVNARAIVGDVILTPVNATDLIFSWHLDGQAGSERLTRLGAGACPPLNGIATNINGAWYAPAQGGYGMDIAALPDLQFAAFYFYDALGIARWGSGGASPFAANSSISLTQNHGFCPICDFASVTSQPLGTLNVGYSNATNGTYSTNLVLQSPLTGAWNTSQPTARLTGTSACTQ